MSNDLIYSSSGSTEAVCCLGKAFFLCASPPGHVAISLLNQAVRQADVHFDGRDFILFELKDDAAPGSISVSPTVFMERLGIEKTSRASFLGEVFGPSATTIGLFSDPGAASAIENALSSLEAQRYPFKVISIEEIDTIVVVYPRQVKMDRGQGAFFLSKGSVVSGRVSQTGKFLGQRSSQFRLATIDLSSDISARQIMVLTDDGIAVGDIQLEKFSSISQFFHTYIRQDVDVLQIVYQASKAARPIVARLLAQHPAATAVVEQTWNFNFRIERTVSLPEGLFISGWFLDPEDRLLEVVAIDHRLAEPNIHDIWKTTEDRTENGGKLTCVKRFYAFSPAKMKSETSFMRVRVTLRGGITHILGIVDSGQDAVSMRDTVLGAIQDRTFSGELFEDVFQPALAPLQRVLNDRQAVISDRTFGIPSCKKVSLIVPLYRQLSFIRSQLMAMANDAFIRNECEVIFVLDDPALDREASALLRGFSAYLPLDVRLLTLVRNGGYAMANNLAVASAEGEHLVLLNSDVIPTGTGWVEAAIEELNALPDFSIIGPKLLYADNSLQHAGMLFERFPHGFWQNLHYWKGFGRGFEPARHKRVVPAVTGACMVLKRADFLAVGGFTADYVIGDYEDSDLCLKLRAKGGVPLYVPGIELYHFERQSMPSIGDGHDRRSTIYNRALHTARWNQVIEELMVEFSKNEH